MQAEDGTVADRRVFYIPGYDPFPPRRYRELYRKEGAAQAALSGYGLTVRGQGAGWQVAGDFGGLKVNSHVEVMVWSDIVQGSMGHGIAATYGQMLRTAWIYISTGAIFRLARLRKGPTIAALYPIAMLLVQLTVAVAVGWVARGLAVYLAAALPGYGEAAVGWAAGLATGCGVLTLFRRADGRLFAYYLMHDYAYAAGQGGANPPALEQRMTEFGARIGAALQGGHDEVLVVGHSSGAHLAVSVLADLIRAGAVPGDRPVLGFLSLGHVVPMVSFLPDAGRLRGDLAYLSTRDELTWVDVTAPGDGCAFALCDPVSVTGVAPPDKRWPLIVSAAFTRTLSAARWRELRWRFFRLHFQYLCAFDALPDTPSAYDYFRITAGPQTLAARYRNRAPSVSRIERPMSGYRSVGR
jgi:hypothetical protein